MYSRDDSTYFSLAFQRIEVQYNQYNSIIWEDWRDYNSVIEFKIWVNAAFLKLYSFFMNFMWNGVIQLINFDCQECL